jgi:hypothetical protein
MNSLNNKSLLFITLILLFGFGVLYWLLKPVPNSWEKDSDRDGLVDQEDTEDNTPWIADTAMYPLSAYVDSLGMVDYIKTKPLCDCWKFPDIKDRKILKCQENSSWFIVKGELFQYRDGDYYKADNRINADEDDDIEEYHKKRFTTAHEQNPLQQNPDALTTFTYKNQKYQIKQGFLSEDGMIFNGARWRYYQNTWKKSNDNSAPYDNWKDATQEDINHLLKGKKIQTGQTGTGQTGTGQTGTGQTRTGQTAQENPPAGADDQYWIDLKDKNDFTSDEIIQIKAKNNIKTNLSKKGRAAKQKVMHRLHDY